MIELYDIIYADPPWKYKDGKNNKIKPPYPSMTFDELKSFFIPAKDNSMLFMWTTNGHLKVALELMEHWNFSYITNIIWDKINATSMVMWHISHHEILLLGRKGNGLKLPPHNKVSRSVVRIKKSSVHSEKPQFFRNLIDDMFPDKTKVELFARNSSIGWNLKGNQIGSKYYTLNHFGVKDLLIKN